MSVTICSRPFYDLPFEVLSLGVFSSKRAIFVGIVKHVFKHHVDFWTQFIIAARGRWPDDFHYSDVFDTNRNDLLYRVLFDSRDENPRTPAIVVTGSTLDVAQPVLFDEYNSGERTDVFFAELKTNFNPDHVSIVFDWIYDDTIDDHLAFLVFAQIFTLKNGFTNGLDRRIASMMWTTI